MFPNLNESFVTMLQRRCNEVVVMLCMSSSGLSVLDFGI